jgi:hypothetical protein
LIDKAQALINGVERSEELETTNDWEHSRNMEISDDELCLIVLNGKQLPANCEKVKDCTYNITIGVMNV